MPHIETSARSSNKQRMGRIYYLDRNDHIAQMYLNSNQNSPKARGKKKGNHSRNRSNSSISQSGMKSLQEKMVAYTKPIAMIPIEGVIPTKPKVKKAISELKMPSLD